MTAVAGPAESRMTVESIVVVPTEQPVVVLEGVYSGAAPTSVAFAGTRQELRASVLTDGTTWSAKLPMLNSRWKSAPLPPRSGRYTLESDACEISITAELPAPQLVKGVTRIDFAVEAGKLIAGFEPPLSDRERGPLQQSALETDYRHEKYEPLDAVFFESFFGRNASCNPRAIDRAIAEQRPDIQRYWSVADASIEVPEGAIAIIDGSAEWWRIRGSARLLVVNDWLRKRYRKRKYQTVLQTWHGTMLKKLALSRSNLGARSAVASVLESRRWNILLAQNQHSRHVFRRAYAYLGQIWDDGYPRDDVLLTGDASAVRARLDIPDDVTVLLYAPTWRDDHPDHVDHLDVAAFAADLGPGYVTLIRGHSRTLLPGEDVHAPGVIDVTGYPDVSELFLVADALVTDYSSVMFDFTVTEKPIFFFTPDLQHYREKLRGFYFDLLEVAPGPVVSRLNELVQLVRDRDAIAPTYADRYAAWRARFNPRDDGRAAERVVVRLLAEGYIG
jgi:CDP-glycerol glycerophosphotransferase